MSPAEVLPLLVVVILLLSASGVDPDRMEVVFDGEGEATALEDALVVAGGTVTVPAGSSVAGQLYVIGGTLRVDGEVDGDVTQLAGNVSVAAGAAITGEFQTISGDATVASGAAIGDRTRLDVAPQPRSPASAAGFLALRVLVLALFAALLVRRAPGLLPTVADAITKHTVVSGVVGSLAGASMLVLLVTMAFTLVLLPLSVVGLAAQVGIAVYGYLGVGYVIGQRLPLDRVDLASAVGTGVLVLGLELFGRLPLLGGAVQFGVIVVGFGAVLITYLGLQPFEPARLPG